MRAGAVLTRVHFIHGHLSGSQLTALAEMLQALARNWYPELAGLLDHRNEELTGVTPPMDAGSELPR
ncbi:hypothetical protein Kpho01_67490 [Kitasatospora phosalacinea]|uniref:Uncharacterized protein n=1 Tax=Kitasatospora phosalacinea TaxID=2065 RepID=A0A9W6USM1_9ACTN|nr:hypothetical protein Kpho01_67490 [Kitasatospora phosalacinea]